MGDEPVGGDDKLLDEIELKNGGSSRNSTPHALDDPERIRVAIYDALENHDSSADDETE